MPKKIIGLDEKLQSLLPPEELKKEEAEMPTLRMVLRATGNIRAESADDARRIHRIVNKLREKNSHVVLENDDIIFLQRTVEKNSLNLSAWMLGQILDSIESAEKVDLKK